MHTGAAVADVVNLAEGVSSEPSDGGAVTITLSGPHSHFNETLPAEGPEEEEERTRKTKCGRKKMKFQKNGKKKHGLTTLLNFLNFFLPVSLTSTNHKPG